MAGLEMVAVRQNAASPSNTVAVRVIRISLCGSGKIFPTLQYLLRGADLSQPHLPKKLQCAIGPPVKTEGGPAISPHVLSLCLELSLAQSRRASRPTQEQVLIEPPHERLGGLILDPPVARNDGGRTRLKEC